MYSVLERLGNFMSLGYMYIAFFPHAAETSFAHLSISLVSVYPLSNATVVRLQNSASEHS